MTVMKKNFDALSGCDKGHILCIRSRKFRCASHLTGIIASTVSFHYPLSVIRFTRKRTAVP